MDKKTTCDSHGITQLPKESAATVACSSATGAMDILYTLPPEATPPHNAGIEQLTHKELNCLYWIAQGKSSRQIAVHYNRTTDTINHHIKSACKKLGVQGRLQAVLCITYAGLLEEGKHPMHTHWAIPLVSKRRIL